MQESRNDELIHLIKYSSPAYRITCIDLTGQGKIIASETFRSTEILMIVGVIHLFLTTVSSSRPGFGCPGSSTRM